MVERSRPQNLTPNAQPVTFWRADGLFNATKLTRVWTNPTVRNKFSGPNGFMDTKRSNPNQPFGASDKSFTGGGKFQNAVPGLKHAHLTHDLSVVYRVEGSNIYLYGFFTHDDLGTGNPGNRRKQDAMADRFANANFIE
jgi:hypothetical protein